MVCDNDLVDFQYELRDCEAKVDTLQICSRGMRLVSSQVVGVAGLALGSKSGGWKVCLLTSFCLATVSRPWIGFDLIREELHVHLTPSLSSPWQICARGRSAAAKHRRH
jgi:hypothetical protein